VVAGSVPQTEATFAAADAARMGWWRYAAHIPMALARHHAVDRRIEANSNRALIINRQQRRRPQIRAVMVIRRSAKLPQSPVRRHVDLRSAVSSTNAPLRLPHRTKCTACGVVRFGNKPDTWNTLAAAVRGPISDTSTTDLPRYRRNGRCAQAWLCASRVLC